ncbi:MAG TPA: hypothetical protein PLF35_15695 [Prolixibacteraceae bacterium]|nr:hypothetical protein [Prolixibacteraceae bacterium]
MNRMAKQLIIIFLSVLFIGTQSFLFGANTTLTDTETEIYEAFSEINELVSLIETDNTATYNQLLTTNSLLVENVSASAAMAMNTVTDTQTPFISAFLWGCIFNVPGMLIVGITTGFDSYHMKKSAWGCLISSLLWGGSGYFFSL